MQLKLQIFSVTTVAKKTMSNGNYVPKHFSEILSHLSGIYNIYFSMGVFLSALKTVKVI